jgi:two-component system, chemotaxis family, protein-glutamate methylesterase/glutaminase
VDAEARPRGEDPQRVIGIGASAGGVDALRKVVARLPADLPFAVCVVLHLPATGRSLLAPILDRATEMTAELAADGVPLEAGRIYVAPSDQHLVVEDGRVALTRGPKENGSRPAVDPMLRSLATFYRECAVAVVLSGALGDGASGAAAVAQSGGVVIVQDPSDALTPSMPERALLASETPLVLPASEIGLAIADLAAKPVSMREDAVVTEPAVTNQDPFERPKGPPTGLTCPECKGALWDISEGELVRYRCRVGHVFSEDALVEEQGTAVEAALWAALEVLEERAETLRRVARNVGERNPGAAARLEDGAQDAISRGRLIRRALEPASGRSDLFHVDEALGGAS